MKPKQYKISEEIHAIVIVEAGLDPDDYIFGRVKPVWEISYDEPDAIGQAQRALVTFNSFEKPEIITRHVYPPIPLRSFDWLAFRRGNEETGPFGWAKTEAEAIAELKENEE
jgi:hypothetical protein